MSSRACLALAAMLLTACGTPASNLYQAAGGTYGGGRPAGLVVHYGTQTLAIAADAFADGMTGRPGEIEIHGPLHLRCNSTFAKPIPIGSPFDVFLSGPEKQERSLRRLPFLEFPSIRVPKGNYTFQLTRPVPDSALKVGLSFTDDLPKDAITGMYRNDGCTEIADSSGQRRTLVAEHFSALAVMIPQVSDTAFKKVAGDLNNGAAAALATGDLAGAATDLDRIISLAAALPSSTTIQVITAVAREGAALLRQNLSA